MSSRTDRGRGESSSVQPHLDRDLLRDIAGLAFMAVGILTLLFSLSIISGPLGTTWVGFLRQLFGWGVHIVSVALVAVGLCLVWEPLADQIVALTKRVVGLEILFLSLLGLTHAFVDPAVSYQVAEAGGGGGLVGWALSYLLAALAGRLLSVISLLAAVMIGIVLLTDFDRGQLGDWQVRVLELLQRVMPREALSEERSELVGPEDEEDPAPRVRKRSGRKGVLSTPQERTAEKARGRGPRRRRDRRLPPLDLLEKDGDSSYSDADVQFRKDVIEETLASFGVPARVVEIRQGPTVTQFGVEPGFLEYSSSSGDKKLRKVRVSKIMSLQDDLALALAAAPLRIEAPVPGRSVVGIEVPNVKPSLVRLRSVVESKRFQQMKGRLRVTLGKDVAGQAVVADLAEMPHVLIAGATNSGKSVCINSIIACLLLENTPDDLRMLMVDPKMVELTVFNGIPHLLAPVVTKVEDAVRALFWVTKEMDERFRMFSHRGARDIDRYNRMAEGSGEESLPRVVVLIDELADLMMTAPDEIERSICRIAQMARATGIHLVIATQRPSVDVVTGLIKANFPARISFAVTSQVDSRVILDAAGAEKLLSRGDMLYMASDSGKLVRLQGSFVSDAELHNLANYWREKADWLGSEETDSVPWQDMDDPGEETDELLGDAIALAEGRKTLSTSFLQRRLRVGYPRAAHLMDVLEERGIVGPAENAGRSRQVLMSEDVLLNDEADLDED